MPAQYQRYTPGHGNSMTELAQWGRFSEEKNYAAVHRPLKLEQNYIIVHWTLNIVIYYAVVHLDKKQ